MYALVADDAIVAFDFVNEPLAFALPAGQGEEIGSYAVSPDASRVVYLAGNDLVCMDRAGQQLWRQPLPTMDPEDSVFMRQTEFSLDGKLLWHYRQDGRFEHDSVAVWQVIDAGTGIVLAGSELDAGGFGGGQDVHPDGVHTLLTLNDDEGFRTVQGRFNGVAIEITPLPLFGRGLLGLSRDGSQMMTIGNDARDVAFHAYPSCGITGRVRVEDFGEFPEQVNVSWIGGYLDQQVAVVVLDNEDDDDWHRAYLVDPHTARVLGPFETHAHDLADMELLGDGSWVTIDEDGNPIRHRRP